MIANNNKNSLIRFIKTTGWLALLTVWCCLAIRPASAEPLPALNADLSRLSVSGLSSGAYMAGQFHFAYSQSVMGAALVAGGPYGCAFTPGSEFNPLFNVVLLWNLDRAQNNCMEDGWFFSTVPSVSGLIRRASAAADRGDIDPLQGLTGDRVYLFTSHEDETVESGVAERAYEMYREAGIAEGNIAYIEHDKAAHAFLTEEGGLACGTTGSPFINDCDYDQAEAILKFIYGELQPSAAPVDASFISFEQQPFTAGLPESGFSEQGIAYVPQSCRDTANGACALHVVFHGCKQGMKILGDTFVKSTGYAKWAEANQLIILFPQVEASTLNPNGCWDWWGYSGRNFLEKNAPQMLGVKRMIDRIGSAVQ